MNNIHCSHKRQVKFYYLFVTIYKYEEAFSAFTNMKTKYRSRIAVDADLRVCLSHIAQRIDICAVKSKLIHRIDVSHFVNKQDLVLFTLGFDRQKFILSEIITHYEGNT